ncbi:hypothetical protein D9M68_854500 [compost metagenome]
MVLNVQIPVQMPDLLEEIIHLLHVLATPHRHQLAIAVAAVVADQVVVVHHLVAVDQLEAEEGNEKTFIHTYASYSS